VSKHIHGPGDVIGKRYEIRAFIDEGGMQEVYTATDTVLRREVALKAPKNETAAKRFRRSAVVSAKVNHPNVAKTLDYVIDGDRSYLIEELISGRDLRKVLAREVEVLDPYLAARMFHHLCRGVSAAHHAGVMHRDLKPSNVMVLGESALSGVKITDFGIAKMAEEELIEAAEGGESSISGSKTMIGALPYMAPEAIEKAKSTGQSADIWAVGAMLYEMLSGERPFGSGLPAVPNILKAEPPAKPRILNGNHQLSPLASQLFDIVLRCLNKDPKARPSADELLRICGTLCYPLSERRFGRVRDIRYNAWGFISDDGGSDIFFHLSSVYGAAPAEGDRVCYCCFLGGGADRAHPVLKMRPDAGAPA